eukprot:1147236-Pelagomonas_calceolata.AAC.1
MEDQWQWVLDWQTDCKTSEMENQSQWASKRQADAKGKWNGRPIAMGTHIAGTLQGKCCSSLFLLLRGKCVQPTPLCAAAWICAHKIPLSHLLRLL